MATWQERTESWGLMRRVESSRLRGELSENDCESGNGSCFRRTQNLRIIRAQPRAGLQPEPRSLAAMVRLRVARNGSGGQPPLAIIRSRWADNDRACQPKPRSLAAMARLRVARNGSGGQPPLAIIKSRWAGNDRAWQPEPRSLAAMARLTRRFATAPAGSLRVHL